MRSIQRLDPTLGWIPPAAGSHSRQLGIVREGLVSSRVQLDANSSEELLDLQTTVGPHHTQPFFGGGCTRAFPVQAAAHSPFHAFFGRLCTHLAVHSPSLQLLHSSPYLAAALTPLRIWQLLHSSPYLAAALTFLIWQLLHSSPYLAAALCRASQCSRGPMGSLTSGIQ